MTTTSLPPRPKLSPLDLVSVHYRYALLNAVCVLSLSADKLVDDDLVARAKELLKAVDDNIRRTYWKEKNE